VPIQPKPDQVAWSVRHWCEATDLSPAYCYELLAAGKIEGVRCGGKRLILTPPRESLESLTGEETRIKRSTYSDPGAMALLGDGTP
jgi:hypothetical protein